MFLYVDNAGVGIRDGIRRSVMLCYGGGTDVNTVRRAQSKPAVVVLANFSSSQ